MIDVTANAVAGGPKGHARGLLAARGPPHPPGTRPLTHHTAGPLRSEGAKVAAPASD
jgi:hypothetical protein